MQYDRELPSKFLYQWVQKKGRVIDRKETNFQLDESQQKENILDFYRSLNTSQSEASRVSFVIKYVKSQYGVTLTSKQLFSWLSDKGKKSGKKR